MDQYQQYIALSRYARYLWDQGRRETWSETVDRVANYWKAKVDDPELDEVFERVENLDVMPSMRTLMTAGPALDRDQVAGYNCAYTTVKGDGEEIKLWDSKLEEAGFDQPISISLRNPIVFDEIMYVLLCGTGMGFSVERQFVNEMPTVGKNLSRSIYKRINRNYPGVPKEELSTFDKRKNTVVVTDSKYGWASALRILIVELYNGNFDVQWDTSNVRPAGAPLKTFGGRASGPEPLHELFTFLVEVFRAANGRKLTSIECHDVVCKIAQVVVVGGVRRSALISLSNLSDDRMRAAKSGEWWNLNPQRALANNSVCYTETPTVGAFMEEWKALYDSKSGERGIFNREAARKQFAEIGRKWVDGIGCNPCCVTGDTYILTDRGHLPIETLINKPVNVWNGVEFSQVVPFETGEHPVAEITLSDGTSLTCTYNHKFPITAGGRNAGTEMVELRHLVQGMKLQKYAMPVVDGDEDYDGDAYTQGFYQGDGNTGLEHSWLYETKYCCQTRLKGVFGAEQKAVSRKTWRHGEMRPKDFVPLNGRVEYMLNWLAGLMDADGTVVVDKQSALQLASADKDFLVRVRLLLTQLGVQAKLNQMSEGGMRDFADGYPAYECQPVFRLLINQIDRYRLAELGLKCERLQIETTRPQRDARRFVTVESIEPLGVRPTYCFDEPKQHLGTFNGIVTGQSEILLRDREFCNLSEVVVREHDTIQELRSKVRAATILGTLQSTLTDFVYLSPKWKENCDEERLLGVSLTGVMDHRVLRDTSEVSSGWLLDLREVARETNKEWAKKLGIPSSAAITCVKPSGTVSQLVNSASGLHPRYSKYYIRTVRADKKDPLAQMMIDQGVPHEEDFYSAANWVFSFPVAAPSDSVMRNDRTAVEQLEHWLMFQRDWCDHKPSITVYVREHEWMEVGAWVWDHFDEVSGVSFLPHSDHSYKQAPYQEITEEQYLQAVEKMPQIDWSRLPEYEHTDLTTGMQEYACAGGACEIA